MNHNRTFSSLMLLSALAVLGGCSGQEPTMVNPTTDLIDKSTHALSAGALKAAYGTYTTCQTRTDGDVWSLLTSAGASGDRGGHSALAVVQNDTACELTLTDLIADTDYAGTPTILLGTSFAVSGSAFDSDVGDAGPVLGFYANADLSSASYSAGFTVNIVFSDNPAATSGSASASYQTVTASSVSNSAAPAPDYATDTSGLSVNVDVNKLVTARSGNLVLTAGSHTGDDYVIVAGALSDTSSFAVVDAAYGAGTPVAISGSPVNVAATSLLALGVDLTSPVVRTVIVHRADSSVSSYQVFAVTFSF